MESKIIGGNFLTTNSTNFHEWGAASRENFIVGFIRVYSEYSWFIFSLQPRSACSLLKWEELTLCVLGVLGGQNAFGSSAVLGSRHSVSREKFSEIFLKPAPLQPMPVCIMIARVWNLETHAE